jgi:hypothetical protein
MDNEGLVDPVWEFLLRERLSDYIPAAREWWSHAQEYQFDRTGVTEGNGPNGFMVRFTRTAYRSPIKGVQAFPFVPSVYLQLGKVQGGYVKMIERVCVKGLTIDEFTIVMKCNLPSTFNQGQFLAIIPTEILEHKNTGLWVYVNHEEIKGLNEGIIPQSLLVKIADKEPTDVM